MPARVLWILVLVCWMAGPFAGGQCLAGCPEPMAAAAASGDCHGATADTALTSAHDCGTHPAPVFETARTEVRAAIAIHVTSAVHSSRAPSSAGADTHLGAARPHLPPPVSFLTPLRQ